MFYDLSEKFRKIIDEKELTLTSFSKIADVHIPTLHNFLNGKNATMPLSAIVNICRHFGISVDDLVSAPLENFSLANLQNKDKEVQSDTVRQEIERLIDNIYNKLDDDGKIWFKVEIKKFLEKIK